MSASILFFSMSIVYNVSNNNIPVQKSLIK